MTEQDFTNREISTMFNNMLEKLDEHANTHSKILNAVNITNGKVADIQAWRERMNGGSIVAVAFLTAIIIPVISWMVYTVSTLDEIIDKSIEKALSVYEIPK